MNESNYVRKVAIVGAGGNVGTFMVDNLLRTGKHTVTALTRFDSQSSLPEGISSKTIDYSKPETLVHALEGQDALVITLSGRSAEETQIRLIHAASEAGVPWILPNEWSPDTAHDELLNDMPAFQSKPRARKAIEKLDKSLYISLCTGFWYDYVLGMPGVYGVDVENRTMTFFDEGETNISTSTRQQVNESVQALVQQLANFLQVGRAVAAIPSLPITSDGTNSRCCLEDLKNKVVYINSFTTNQKEIFGSALRATGTHMSEWTIYKESAEERFSVGTKEVKEGNPAGYQKTSARLFFPDNCGNFEYNRGTLNRLLGLPEEDMDTATKAAIVHLNSMA